MVKINVGSYNKFLSLKPEIEKKLYDVDIFMGNSVDVDEVTKILKLLENSFRVILRSYGYYSPKFTYHTRFNENGVNLTLVRKHYDNSYYNFTYRFFFLNSDVDVFKKTVYKTYVGLFLRLAEEYVVIQDLVEYNKIFTLATRIAYPTKELAIKFVPDTFYGSYVQYISDNELVLVADSNALLKLNEKSIKSKVTVDSLVNIEVEALSNSQSTVEILGRKTPLITYLLNSGRTTIKRLLKGTFSKSLQQLSTYKKVYSDALYFSDDVVGVVNRSEHGVSIVLKPINTKTYLLDNTVDLLDLLDN